MALTSSPHIRAVLFDYGMVLSGPPDPAAWQRMREILNNAPEDAFHRAYWLRRDDYDRGILNGPSYWNTVANQLGIILTAAETDALLAADVQLWTAPNQPMIDWATNLQRRGIRTGILSNLGDSMELGIRARYTWLADFHHHTFSHHLGIAKPDPAIYAHAAQGLGVPPAEILFVDDRAENIAAARVAGMHAIQYTSHDDFLAAMQREGLASLLPPTLKAHA
jgi:putative hydrolase of the HAD superfamily